MISAINNVLSAQKSEGRRHDEFVDGPRDNEISAGSLIHVVSELLVGIRPQIHSEQPVFHSNLQEQPIELPQLWHK